MTDTTCLEIISGAVVIPATPPLVPPKNVGGGGGSVGTLRIRWDVSIMDVANHYGKGTCPVGVGGGRGSGEG